jgi:hypothetical protein
LITREELEELARLEGSDESPILSVYLHVDPSQASNMNRGFEVALRGMLSSIEQQLEGGARRAEFEADARSAADFVARYTPHARSLILFCDASADFLWHREVEVPVADDAHWGRALQLRPLLETLGEYERYGVVLVDRRRARFFSVHLLEIEEHPALITTEEVRRVRSTGTHQVWSQKHFQRRAESHAQDHLRLVAKFAERLFVDHGCDRLVLAGAHDVTAHLAGLLPKRLRSRLAGSVTLAVETTAKSVLEATLEVGGPCLAARLHERPAPGGRGVRWLRGALRHAAGALPDLPRGGSRDRGRRGPSRGAGLPPGRTGRGGARGSLFPARGSRRDRRPAALLMRLRAGPHPRAARVAARRATMLACAARVSG